MHVSSKTLNSPTIILFVIFSYKHMNFFLFERKTNILRLFIAIFNLLLTRLSG